MKDVHEHDVEEHNGVKRFMKQADDLVVKANFSMSSAGLDDLSKAIHSAVELFLQHAKEEEQAQWPELEKKMSKDEIDEVSCVTQRITERCLPTLTPHARTGGT